MNRKEAREFMRNEFGPDRKAKNEDGTRMSEKQLNAAADGWISYFDAMNKILSERSENREKRITLKHSGHSHINVDEAANKIQRSYLKHLTEPLKIGIQIERDRITLVEYKRLRSAKGLGAAQPVGLQSVNGKPVTMTRAEALQLGLLLIRNSQ